MIIIIIRIKICFRDINFFSINTIIIEFIFKIFIKLIIIIIQILFISLIIFYIIFYIFNISIYWIYPTLYIFCFIDIFSLICIIIIILKIFIKIIITSCPKLEACKFILDILIFLLCVKTFDWKILFKSSLFILGIILFSFVSFNSIWFIEFTLFSYMFEFNPVVILFVRFDEFCIWFKFWI